MATKTLDKKPVAWSASRLKTYRACPRKYYHLYVAKDVKDEKSPQMAFGDEVHAALENRVGLGQPLPDKFAHLEKFCRGFDAFNGHVMTERQLAVTPDLEATEWFGRDVGCRAIADVIAVSSNEKQIAVVDWKTGKHNKDDARQLELTCVLALAHFPEAEVAKGALIYVKEEEPERQSVRAQVSRTGMSVVWRSFIPHVQKLRLSMETGDWPLKPSGLCAYCPVKSCTHNPAA